jgi:hypothetical protein
VTQCALHILNRSDCTYSQLILSSVENHGGKFAQKLAHKGPRLWMLRQHTAQSFIVAVAKSISITFVSTAKDYHYSLLFAVAPDEHDVGRQGDHVPVDR